MKFLMRITVLLFLLISCLASAKDDDEAQMFRRLEVAWSEAIRAQDRERIESFLAAEYSLTVAQPTGLSVTDRATWLQNATTVYKLNEFEFKELVVRRYGDVAVVSSFYTQRATVNGRDRSGDAFLTDIWVKTAGKWQVSARYSSDPKARTPQVPPNNSFKPKPLRSGKNMAGKRAMFSPPLRVSA